MGIFDYLKIKNHNSKQDKTAPSRLDETAEAFYHEFCPRCEANLTLQKGYSNDLPFWNCRGCGELLINPSVEASDDIAWICDGCGDMLNIQPGFAEFYASIRDASPHQNTTASPASPTIWNCTKCGYRNMIATSELYLSEDEYEADLLNPYKGLTDEEVLELSTYEEIGSICDREDIILVKNETGLFVKKYLGSYDISIYRHLLGNPISHMPRLYALYEGDNNLIVIEEYIKGHTLSEVLAKEVLTKNLALHIAKSLCEILLDLHHSNPPIIHRDIKPSNIILTEDDEVYLLDINVSKWYNADETEDTKLYGTLYYAAPEQFGYGFSASSEKSDIYAMGILLNVMLTGKMPKEERADGEIWKVIERCIRLEQVERFNVLELHEALEKF